MISSASYDEIGSVVFDDTMSDVFILRPQYNGKQHAPEGYADHEKDFQRHVHYFVHDFQ